MLGLPSNDANGAPYEPNRGEHLVPGSGGSAGEEGPEQKPKNMGVGFNGTPNPSTNCVRCSGML